ncbi:hypothetical protein, partial [Escherichia coli]|uniref:hypothetical protein n=1 Tax=Escherichia coli TaxID=562 RepID=UPI001BC8C7EF
MKDRIPFAVNNITCVILLSLFCNAASAVEFNTDVLDAADAYFHERRSLNNFHRDRVITFEQIAE